jgi:hypothetical protein
MASRLGMTFETDQCGHELCFSCGDLRHWVPAKGTHIHRRSNGWAGGGPWRQPEALPGPRTLTTPAVLQVLQEGFECGTDAALPGSACHGVKLCPIARHERNLRRLGKFLKDKQLCAVILSGCCSLRGSLQLRLKELSLQGGCSHFRSGGAGSPR